MTGLPHDSPPAAGAHLPSSRGVAAASIVACAGELFELGFAPATSGNFSMRVDSGRVAITVSGRDKGKLEESDVILVDLDGVPVAIDDARRPSAETLLHTQLYRRFPEVGCVLHTHSMVQTVASAVLPRAGKVHLRDYELLKALAGNVRHDTTVVVPVLANDQDMAALAAAAERVLDEGPLWGYLIERHGLYVWGRDMAEARRHLAALELLLTCELELRKYPS